MATDGDNMKDGGTDRASGDHGPDPEARPGRRDHEVRPDPARGDRLPGESGVRLCQASHNTACQAPHNRAQYTGNN